ncbi:hypothetical protein CIK81_05245 [Brachybacterium sp. JB7]|uniref:Uncharacterized protein n=2 Tax=Dermabacteraceae TaxID=85020 RepID=A0A2A3YN60_9MICO|nr:hypothetical protein CIK66_02885 [Brachybacterium alimentarium]RCS65598.1 hypothetical protein CIK81_05245 [Brachybacterium sp. JB7]RCS66735.1 hypothetical protein CIK73_11645 [Brachybacterium alimentarium]RCS74485.1 hypothetical protein CIK68_07045 [Brachybacterium alimentarium]RCS78525.1 hypothetical protein CIK72_12225 [Brachybacterium alimentarium]
MSFMASSAHHSARPPAAPEDPERPASGGRSGEDSELQVKKLSPTGLVASGAAAATATVVGGQLGIAGTVVGAALTSVVSATALALYTDSVNRSRQTLKKVAAKGPKLAAPARSQSVHSSRTGSRAVDRDRDAAALGLGDLSAGSAPDDAPSRQRRIVKIAVLAAVIALVGLAAVFGIQRVLGTELSPGTGQIQRSVTGNDTVAPRDDSSTTDRDQQDGTGTEQQEDGAPATEQPDSTTDDTDTQQDDRSTQDEGDAPQQTQAPAEQNGDSAPQGSGTTTDGGSGGSAQGGSGSQQ